MLVLHVLVLQHSAWTLHRQWVQWLLGRLVPRSSNQHHSLRHQMVQFYPSDNCAARDDSFRVTHAMFWGLQHFKVARSWSFPTDLLLMCHRSTDIQHRLWHMVLPASREWRGNKAGCALCWDGLRLSRLSQVLLHEWMHRRLPYCFPVPRHHVLRIHEVTTSQRDRRRGLWQQQTNHLLQKRNKSIPSKEHSEWPIKGAKDEIEKDIYSDICRVSQWR